MENLDERTNRKMYSAMAVAGVLVIATFVAFYMGLIPGIAQGGKVADELKVKVEALRGPNLKTQMLNYASNNPEATKEQKDMINNILADAVIDFEYTGIKTSSGDGKGTIEIDSPKVTASSLDKKQVGEITVPKLFISRDVSDAKHFFFHSEGDIDVSTNISGTMAKMFSISGEQPSNEIKFNADGYSGYFKSSTQNVKFIEGRGNTVVAKIGTVNMESNSSFNTGKMNRAAKIGFKNIMAGDMFKMMLGLDKPVTLNFDYAYKGDNYQEAIHQLTSYEKNRSAEVLKKAADPGYKSAGADIKPFDGDLKVNDFSILMGDAGIVLNGGLQFKKSNASAVPFGEMDLKIAKYQSLIDYSAKFVKMPKEQVDKTVQMLSDIGTNAGGDITFKITFDGTEDVKVNDKTQSELRAISTKYYAPGADVPVAQPPVRVESRPIK